MSNPKDEIKYVGDSRVRANGRRPNISPSYSEYPGKTEPFWPNFLLKEWMVAVVVLMGILVLTVVAPSPLEPPANPTDTSYIPLPDWYFLFLYQLLKYPWASGDFVLIGILVIPGLAFGSLLLAPWLDRSPYRRPSQRPIATGVMLFAIVAIFYLTYQGATSHATGDETATPPPVEENVAIPADDSEQPSATALDGEQILLGQASCLSCHGNDLSGTQMAPALNDVGSRLSQDEIYDVIKNGRADTIMSGGLFNGSDDELKAVAQWLSEQK
ncbi:menaquinol-cytochrome c reductase cytochrome b/c subunit [Rubeoparvulum massiliense]|uniref:menaquinol-cytochrome c reductase cytochrome b/c subunit n=1 Tax=Rubeoparvulum massiliense TaxID=1631346 RepID=UPI00065E5BA2|nr:menaquinol-cytochrome c reductase cytochrome b/c subunit [Rubeoparvulum massiliense]